MWMVRLDLSMDFYAWHSQNGFAFYDHLICKKDFPSCRSGKEKAVSANARILLFKKNIFTIPVAIRIAYC